MENNLDDTILCAEKIYRKLVALDFDLKHGNTQESDTQFNDIWIMFNELKQKLADLSIQTNFPIIQYNDAFRSIKMVEELMRHIENILTVLRTFQTRDNDNTKERQNELVS